jgi:hypothetical protein
MRHHSGLYRRNNAGLHAAIHFRDSRTERTLVSRFVRNSAWTAQIRTNLRRQLRLRPCRRRSGTRRYHRTCYKRIHLQMRRGSRLLRFFLCRGSLNNFHRQGNHSYGKSGWSCCTSHHFSLILIQDTAIVKLTWPAFGGGCDLFGWVQAEPVADAPLARQSCAASGKPAPGASLRGHFQEEVQAQKTENCVGSPSGKQWRQLADGTHRLRKS